MNSLAYLPSRILVQAGRVRPRRSFRSGGAHSDAVFGTVRARYRQDPPFPMCALEELKGAVVGLEQQYVPAEPGESLIPASHFSLQLWVRVFERAVHFNVDS